MQRLNGIDASFFYLETPNQHMHLTGVMVLEPPEGEEGEDHFERMRSMLQERLHLLPSFRQRAVFVPFGLDHPVWIEDPDFDLDSHLRRVALPSPGGMRELAEMVGDIASRPLDRSRPLWEMWLVEGLEGGRVAAVSKMHHATMDGVTGANMMVHMFDLSPEGTVIAPPETEWEPEEIPKDAELVINALGGPFAMPRRMVRIVRKNASGIVETAKLILSDEETPTLPFTAPRTKFSGAITPHRSVAFGQADLEDLKFIKNTFSEALGRVTINDVVLATCTQSLRVYLENHDDLPDRSLVASCPVSTHTGAEGEATNSVSNMFVSLPVHLDDMVEQLTLIREDTQRAKVMQNAIGADILQDINEFAPPAVFAQAMRLYSRSGLADVHRPVQNLIVSNVPGPPIPLYTAGSKVVSTIPFGPILEGQGLNITVLSSMGTLDFGVIGCRELVPDIWEIADGWADTVRDLKKEAERLTAKAAKKPATKKRAPAKKKATSKKSPAAKKKATAKKKTAPAKRRARPLNAPPK